MSLTIIGISITGGGGGGVAHMYMHTVQEISKIVICKICTIFSGRNNKLRVDPEPSQERPSPCYELLLVQYTDVSSKKISGLEISEEPLLIY